jgi:hypothetical protein
LFPFKIVSSTDDDLCKDILAQFEKLGLADAIVDDLSTTDESEDDDKNRD